MEAVLDEHCRPLPTEILYSILFHSNNWPVPGSSTSI